MPSSEILGKSAGLDVPSASIAVADAGSSEAELRSIIERVKQFN